MSELRTPPPPEHPLDMASTIAFYDAQADRIIGFLPPHSENPLAVEVSDQEHIDLSSAEISALIGLFPQTARDRSTLIRIEGRDTLYFHKDSTFQVPVPTDSVEEAITPTAFIPAKTEYSRDDQGVIKSTIVLYATPDVSDQRVRKIIHAQGLVHEYAHTLITPILYSSSYRLRLPSGEVVEGKEFIERFVALAEATTPFSKYVEEYRKSGRYEDEGRKTTINEELSEAITGALLGFVSTKDDSRGLDPFADRPEMRQLVTDFLSAEKVE